MKLRQYIFSSFLLLIALFSNVGLHFYFHHCNTCRITEFSLDSSNISCERHNNQHHGSEHACCCSQKPTHQTHFNNHCCEHGKIAFVIPYQFNPSQPSQLSPVCHVLPNNFALILNQRHNFSDEESADFEQNPSPPFPFIGIDYQTALHCFKIAPATL